MDDVWSWIAGIVVSLLIIALVVYGSPGRQSYYRARGAIQQRATAAYVHGSSPFNVAAAR